MDIRPDLSGRTALVTGCRRGIGRAIAEALAVCGADILGTSASISDNDPVAQAVRAAGRRFTALPCDLSKRAAVLALADTLAREHAPVDILVNNAGTIRRAPAAEHPDSDWDEVIATNLTAPFLLTREIGRGMIARGAGKWSSWPRC